MKNRIEEEYLGVLSDLVHGAPEKEGRNGMTRHRWGRQIRHDMTEGFPLLSTKEIWYKGAFAELIWILNGRTDMQYLHDNRITYWNKNYEESGRDDGTLGPVYGKQMRDFFGIDQLKTVIKGMQDDPHGRRHLIDLWNPYDQPNQALPCCWYSIQFNIENDYMDILWTQRSADWFLGVPFDLAMMSCFLQMLSRGLHKTPRYVVGSFADVHLYEEHIEPAKIQLSRDIGGLPSLSSPGMSLYKNTLTIPTPDTLEVVNYNPQSKIKAVLK